MAAPAVKSLLRRSFLTMTALVASALGVSCVDVAGGGGGSARILINPQFSPRDAAIYSSLRQFGLGATSVSVYLLRPNTTDTVGRATVALAEGQDEVNVPVDALIRGTEEWLVARLEIRSGDLLLFEGSLNVLARAGANVGGPTPVLVPVWVGPGANATRVEIQPRQASISATGRVAFTATAYDANNAAITDPEYVGRFQWRVLETTLGTIPLGGGEFVGAGTGGAARVTVFTPNRLADTVTVTLVAQPVVSPATSTVTLSSSSIVSGSVATITLQARDAAGTLVTQGGAAVAFALAGTGTSAGTIGPVTDNGNGTYTASLTGTVAGTARAVSATINGAAVTSAQPTFSVTPGAPVSIVFATGLTIIDAGAAGSLPSHTAKDAAGNTVPGTSLTYASRTPGVATVATGGALSGVAKGQAVVVASAGSVADSVLVVVAEPNGPVLLTSIDRFGFGTDQTITVSVFMDMRTSNKRLGSTTVEVAWDPAQLAFQSNANGASGVSPTVNNTTAGTGKLTLAMADVSGFPGRVELLRITFRSSSAATTGALRLLATEITASDFADLLGSTTQVTHPIAIR